MSAFPRRVAGLFRLAAGCSLLLITGCGGTPLERAGVSGLRPSEGWTEVDPSRFAVPGRAIAAWSGPNGSSLVVAKLLAVPHASADTLTREMSARFENLPELRIVQASKKKIGGIESAYIEVVAPGTGDALAPTGLGKPIAPPGKELVDTRRISLGIPAASQTLWLIWHAPEASAGALTAEIEKAIKNLAIQDRPAASY
jgi:hypothetical protein